MKALNKQALLDSAKSTLGILENISGFESSDIDGDTVELRFETEGGFDTGCDVSIVDQCQKAADVIRALLDELEVAKRERDNWRNSFDNERFRADKLAEAFKTEHEQLVMANRALITQHVRANGAEKRIAELEAREIVLPKRLSPEGYHIDEAYMVDDAEGEYLDRDEVIEAIRAAGIGVKGE